MTLDRVRRPHQRPALHGQDLSVRVPFHGQDRRAVVVLGMHRSGTSVVARGLAALGVDLGEHFLPVNDENATGFWEDVEVVSLNDRILAALGASWESVAEPDVGRLSPADASRFDAEARAIIGSRFSGQLWGFKDPRTARLLPFWQSAFERLQITPAYVIVVRHPSCVARSLVGRGVSPQHACLLWLQHNHAAVAGTAGAARVFVDYDRLLASPAEVLRRVARGLGLPLTPAVEGALRVYERDFIDPSLRHNVVSAAEASESTDLCGLASRAYEVLGRVLETGLEDDPAWIAEWQSFGARIDAVAPLAAWTDALIGDQRRITAEHRARVREHAEHKARADALERQVSRLESQYSVLAAAFRDKASAARDLGAAREHLEEIRRSHSWRVTAPLRLGLRVLQRASAWLPARHSRPPHDT